MPLLRAISVTMAASRQVLPSTLTRLENPNILHPGFDIFKSPPLDASVRNSINGEVATLTNITQTGPYVFLIKGMNDYLDLENIFLIAKCQILRANDTALAAPNHGGPIANVLHSLFSKVEVKLNGVSVEHSNNLYHIKAYINNLLFSKGQNDTLLNCEGFVLDDPNRFDETDTTAAYGNKNTGLVKRRTMILNETTLMGRLHTDICRQPAYLPDGVELEIVLHRNPNDLVIMGQANCNHKIKITDLKLQIRKVSPASDLLVVHKNLMDKMIAQYPIQRCQIRSYLIPAGVTHHVQQNFFTGRLPHTVILGFIENATRVGSYDTNTFKFSHHHLNKCRLLVNNETVNHVNGLITDFDTVGNNHTNAYVNLLQNTGLQGSDAKLSLDDFKQGYALFPFRLSPNDREDGAITHVYSHGSLNIELSFAVATAANLDVIVYALWDNTVAIDRNRKVTLDLPE